MGGTSDKTGKGRTCIENSSRKTWIEKTHGKPRRTCENNIKMYLRAVKSDILAGWV